MFKFVKPKVVPGVVVLISAAVLSLSGCTGSELVPPPPVPSSGPVTSKTWHPGKPITHEAPFTESEKLKLRASYLRSLAESSKIRTPPKVSLIRWTTIDDVDKVWADCFTKNGFPAVPAEDGVGIEYGDGMEKAQESASFLVEYTCISKYSLDPKYLRDWTDEQVGLIYDYFVQSYLPCVRAKGVTVEDPPTRATYIAKFPSGWDPVMATAGRKGIAADCPPKPPSADMYG